MKDYDIMRWLVEGLWRWEGTGGWCIIIWVVGT